MGLKLVPTGKKAFICSHKWQIQRVGEIDQRPLRLCLLAHTMSLQFYIKPVGKGACQPLQHCFCRFRLTCNNHLVNWAFRPTGQTNKPITQALKRTDLDMRRVRAI